MKPPVINPARVDFVTLRLFCATAKSGSITRGAAECHLALSAASRRLSEFEDAAGIQLLERTSLGVRLTPAGLVAHQHALRLFQGFERFSFELGEFSKGARGHVRLWANMSALTEFLPELLVSFMNENPQIRVELEEQVSGDTVRALLEGMADVGVLAEDTPAEGLVLLPFRSDELCIICSTDHPIHALKCVTFATCLQYDFVGLNRGSSLLELASRAAADGGSALRIRVQVRSFDAMCQMVAANLGIGMLPVSACRPHLMSGRLKAVRLEDRWAQRKLLVAYNANREVSATARLLLTSLVPNWQSASASASQ